MRRLPSVSVWPKGRDRPRAYRFHLPGSAEGRWAVAVRPLLDAPRADPYVQLSRIRLLPRVCDGKALIGPGMKDTRFWEPLVNQPGHASPVETRQLAASGEHPMPAFGDLGPECHEHSTVRRYCVVIE